MIHLAQKDMEIAKLLEMNGKRLDSYKTRRIFNGCQMTEEIIATYHCHGCNRNEQWDFKFYYWRMPTHQYGVYNLRLSSFEKCLTPKHLLKLTHDYQLHLN